MPGKVAATSNKLKPENVGWDVTVPVDASTSDFTPLVFETGYRIEYIPNGRAIPLPGSGAAAERGIAVTSVGMTASYLRSSSDGTVANFISDRFDAKGKTFRQLTPDGPLP